MSDPGPEPDEPADEDEAEQVESDEPARPAGADQRHFPFGIEA